MDQEQLRNLEAQCIQEHAPPCTAACPLHVDVRGVLAALARADFDAALQLLAKRLPFPAIIGRVCEQPCRAVCHRGELGGALTIAALERACADFGTPKAPPRIPRRGKRVAVVGGGLSGITAAFDLTRKGYSVTLFEATDRVGVHLWETDEATLPRDLLTAELAAALQGVDVRLSDPADADRLTALRADFDAVYLGVGKPQKPGFSPLSKIPVFLSELAQSADPTTFATAQDGIFAGGRRRSRAPSPMRVHGMCEGLRLPRTLRQLPQAVHPADLQQPFYRHGRTALQHPHQLVQPVRLVRRGPPRQLRGPFDSARLHAYPMGRSHRGAQNLHRPPHLRARLTGKLLGLRYRQSRYRRAD